MEFRIAVAAAAFGLATIVPAQATPCMIVTITGAQGGPQAYQGQAGPGTLVRYGEDADNCNAVRLQFDTGRGTLLRLSQINVLSSQINAVFFTHMHNDHSEGFADLIQHRWLIFPTSPKFDVVCSDDVASPLGSHRQLQEICRPHCRRRSPIRRSCAANCRGQAPPRRWTRRARECAHLRAEE